MKHRIVIRCEAHSLSDFALKQQIAKCITAALDKQGVDTPCEINVLVTDDEGIRAINKAYRQIDKATDVLSFPMNELLPGEFDPDACEWDYENDRALLGDMVISMERCAEQAETYGHSFAHEVSYLTVHSVLHLLGYDHVDEGEDKRRMRAREKEIMRLLDVLYAIPDILLAVAIIAAFGANLVNLVIALSVSSIAVYARTVRATVLGLANSEFVEAARSCGARDWNIIFRHIIPNSMAPIIVRMTMGIGTAVLSTSSLSYLGLGVEPNMPEWGNILKIGSQYLETNPYLAIFPGLAIIILVLAFNFFGDGLRDAFDPKLKS